MHADIVANGPSFNAEPSEIQITWLVSRIPRVRRGELLDVNQVSPGLGSPSIMTWKPPFRMMQEPAFVTSKPMG
jgi:hypothetical protein